MGNCFVKFFKTVLTLLLKILVVPHDIGKDFLR